ncbi:ArsR family transcriptional regulator, partial [Mesorhizobium sp. M4B.F.Ca.ET.088.02.2.1]
FAEAGLAVEDSEGFEPRGQAEARLTVKLWLGRDRRMLIADPSNDTLPARETA